MTDEECTGMNVGTRPGTWSSALLTALIVMAAASTSLAQDGVAGTWRTEVEGMRGSTVVIMTLEQDATGRWVGTMRSSRNREEVIELESVRVDGNRVNFRTSIEIPGQDVTVRSEYDLRLNPVDDRLKGEVAASVPGMGTQEADLEFTRVIEKIGGDDISFIADRPVVGAWSARPDDDDEEREIQLRILGEGNEYRGTLTDTGIDETVELRDLGVNEQEQTVSFNFRFDGAPFMSSFWGRYDEENDRLRGSMSIGGRSQPLTFDRTSSGPESLFEEQEEPLPVKHPGKFAVSGRLSYWQPLYVLKEKVRNINDITTAKVAFDLGFRYHVIDYLAFQVRYVRGGLGFDTNERNLGLFDPVDGPQGGGFSDPLTTDSELTMDGFEFSVVGFLGQSLFPESKFNPYLIGVAGRTDWTLTVSGRGSDPVAIAEQPLEGTDWTFGGGLGTEYALTTNVGLEFEWLWAYTTTQDDTVWLDTTEQWTSQHVFRFSAGAVIWF
jgi:hypothetical protein